MIFILTWLKKKKKNGKKEIDLNQPSRKNRQLARPVMKRHTTPCLCFVIGHPVLSPFKPVTPRFYLSSISTTTVHGFPLITRAPNRHTSWSLDGPRIVASLPHTHTHARAAPCKRVRSARKRTRRRVRIRRALTDDTRRAPRVLRIRRARLLGHRPTRAFA